MIMSYNIIALYSGVCLGLIKKLVCQDMLGYLKCFVVSFNNPSSVVNICDVEHIKSLCFLAAFTVIIRYTAEHETQGILCLCSKRHHLG